MAPGHPSAEKPRRGGHAPTRQAARTTISPKGMWREIRMGSDCGHSRRNTRALTFVSTYMSILNKLFPETLFPRKLSADAEQRLRLVQARAEEALIRTHVENALLFVDTLSTDVGYERALDIYVREMSVPDPLASVVATRALVALGEALVPAATLNSTNDEGTAEAVPMPRLRLDDAAARRRA